MDFLGMADPGVVPGDTLTGLAFAIIKILAYGALGVVALGVVATCLCDLFECRKWRLARGRTET